MEREKRKSKPTSKQLENIIDSGNSKKVKTSISSAVAARSDEASFECDSTHDEPAAVEAAPELVPAPASALPQAEIAVSQQLAPIFIARPKQATIKGSEVANLINSQKLLAIAAPDSPDLIMPATVLQLVTQPMSYPLIDVATFKPTIDYSRAEKHYGFFKAPKTISYIWKYMISAKRNVPDNKDTVCLM